jgi:hypothetical protein
VRRREFITLAAWPLAARAQTPPLVGYLTVSSKAIGERVAAAFRGGLSEAGFAEGRNVIVEYRYADGQIDSLRSFAEDFVRRGANVIAAMGGIRAACYETSPVPKAPANSRFSGRASSLWQVRGKFGSFTPDRTARRSCSRMRWPVAAASSRGG